MIPEFLLEWLKKDYKNINEIINGYNRNRFISFRINSLKSDSAEIIKVLKENDIDYEIAPFSDLAVIVKNQSLPCIQKLDIYRQGKIYLQSLSSQIPVLFMDLDNSLDILDMTAAPGSKTTQISALTKNKKNIMACEQNAYRFERLKYNLALQGSKANPHHIDSRKLDDYFSFDTILLDAPCSGVGTIQTSDAHSYENISKPLIIHSSELQLELLIKALKILKKGHTMIYSTCSILKIENEDVLIKAQKKIPFEIVPITLSNVEQLPTKIEGTICVLPNVYYEGFFIAKIKKI